MLPGSSEWQVKRAIQKEGSSIFRLNPKLRNGLLSVGGRLENAPIDEDLRHPFILPSHHHVTELLIQYHHSKVGHLGQDRVLSSLREKVLDCERTFCSASHVEEMSRWPEEECA